MTFTVNVVIGLDPTLGKLVSDLAAVMTADNAAILAKLEQVMASLDDLTADVAEETTTIAGLSTFIQGLKDQIGNAGLTPADQAKVDAIFAGLESNKAALASAMTANVPPTDTGGGATAQAATARRP